MILGIWFLRQVKAATTNLDDPCKCRICRMTNSQQDHNKPKTKDRINNNLECRNSLSQNSLSSARLKVSSYSHQKEKTLVKFQSSSVSLSVLPKFRRPSDVVFGKTSGPRTNKPPSLFPRDRTAFCGGTGVGARRV